MESWGLDPWTLGPLFVSFAPRRRVVRSHEVLRHQKDCQTMSDVSCVGVCISQWLWRTRVQVRCLSSCGERGEESKSAPEASPKVSQRSVQQECPSVRQKYPTSVKQECLWCPWIKRKKYLYVFVPLIYIYIYISIYSILYYIHVCIQVRGLHLVFCCWQSCAGVDANTRPWLKISSSSCTRKAWGWEDDTMQRWGETEKKWMNKIKMIKKAWIVKTC